MTQIKLGISDSIDDVKNEEAINLFKSITSEAKKLMIAKNHDYGEAWRDMRVSSLTDLILQKLYRVKQIEKNNGFFLDTLGWIQFKLNDIDKALKSLQLAIELEPNNSEIIDHLGDIYYEIGRKKEAIYEWKRALIGNADDKLKKDILKYFGKDSL